MLTIETKSSGRIGRRDFIRLGTLSLGSLSVAQLAETKAAASSAFVKDRSVVLIYLSGGASQIETFDPKITAPEGIRSVTGEVATSIPGVTFGGTFPRLAQHADKLAIVRSFGHQVGSHPDAHVHMLSGGTDPRGRAEQGFSMGACCARLRGANHPETGLPTYALLTEDEVDRQYQKELGRVRSGSWPGSLGPLYAPLDYQVGWQAESRRNRSAPADAHPFVANMRLSLPVRQLEDRLSLLRAIDRLRKQADSNAAMEALDKYSRQAVDLVLGGAVTAFDLSKEDKHTVARYDTSHIQIGHHQFRPSTLGKQLLVARRLCEAGCGFVTVHSAGWDMHADGNNPGMLAGMEMLGRSLDIALSAFLEDVAARGLDEKILLVLLGDFGRTPKVNKRGGRDHWAKLSPLAFAGGGLAMGQVVGQSTSDAAEPMSHAYTTEDLMATVLHALFDVGKLRLEAGLPQELSRLLDKGKPIHELF